MLLRYKHQQLIPEVGTVTLLFSTTTGENLNFPTTPGII
jgi:hypothetical protein